MKITGNNLGYHYKVRLDRLGKVRVIFSIFKPNPYKHEEDFFKKFMSGEDVSALSLFTETELSLGSSVAFDLLMAIDTHCSEEEFKTAIVDYIC